ncbi:hypothetical protein INR49_003247 [Caranx melampygus]|nr:hypothetical protein INR49_003247 [Caranx melampygus]
MNNLMTSCSSPRTPPLTWSFPEPPPTLQPTAGATPPPPTLRPGTLLSHRQTEIAGMVCIGCPSGEHAYPPDHHHHHHHHPGSQHPISLVSAHVSSRLLCTH